MNCNIGNLDKLLRIVVGAILVVAAVIIPAPLAYIGVIPLITGLMGYCPIYHIVGINTGCKTKS